MRARDVVVLPTCCLVAATKIGRGRLSLWLVVVENNSRDDDADDDEGGGGAHLLIEVIMRDLPPVTIMVRVYYLYIFYIGDIMLGSACMRSESEPEGHHRR